MLTNWDKIKNYQFTELEKTIMKIMFDEYIASAPTSNTEYDAYKHGWMLANISLENPESDIKDDERFDDLEWWWCELCNSAAIICPKCGNTVCPGAKYSCDSCEKIGNYIDSCIEIGSCPLTKEEVDEFNSDY